MSPAYPRGDLMSSLMTQLKQLLRNPRTQAMVERARREAAKPENRRRWEQVRARWARRRTS